MVADQTKRDTAENVSTEDLDQEIMGLFREWLLVFEKAQSTIACDEEAALLELSRIESRIVETPAQGLRGLVVKFGLQRFLSEHADAANALVDSTYADLMRLTGYDPASEILAKLRGANHR